MADESKFTEDVWKTWLEPFHAVRLLIEAGLGDREDAVNWLKGCLRRGELRAGGLHIELLPNELTKCEIVFGRYKSNTWIHVSAIPWKDDFWVSGNYEPDEPLDADLRKPDRDEFQNYLNAVRFEPDPILSFCLRAGTSSTSSSEPATKALSSKGGRPPKAFWEQLWPAIAAQLYVGDLQPKKQADIEKAMNEWLTANNHDAGESTVRRAARALWQAINREDQN